jgi:hypothetical protein
MNKKSGIIVLTLIVGIFVSSFVSADVFLSKQPENTYNIGDTLSVILNSDGSEGWAGADLYCNNQSKMLYFHYLTSDELSVNINVPLSKEFLGGMIGSCYLSVKFNGQTKTSFPFTLNNNIDIGLTFSGNSFKPDESITFSGTAKKSNGKLFNGFASLKFEGIDLEVIVPISNDQFSGNLTIPSNVAAGTYRVIINANEKDDKGEIINFGNIEDSITILQKPTKLSLEAPSSFYPGNESLFKSILYDQTDQKIEKASVSYQLIDVNGNEVLSKLSTTGEANYFIPEKNAPFGYWNLTAVSEEISVQQKIYVEKNMEATFQLINGTLIIQSIGNVPYNKSIEIMIGNETKVKHLNLAPGDSVHFELTAPDGEYEIKISDGDKSELWDGVSLTGAAVSLDGSGKKRPVGLFSKNWLVWIFIIGILGLFIFATSRKIINKNVSINSKNNPKPVKPLDENKGGVVKVIPGKDNKPVIESDSGFAQHSTVIDGSKQRSTLMALKLKNNQELKNDKSSAQEVLKGIEREIIEMHGRVYKNEDFIIGIFTPMVTKNFENDMSAVRCSKLVLKKLKDYNFKFSQKIEFGIAVNSGDIIAKKDSGKLLFTAIGNTLSDAKKIAEIAKNDILLSEETHKKVMSQVKTTLNSGSGAFKTYIITDVVDRESNSKFIESFLQRNQDFKTLRNMRLGRLEKEDSQNSLNKPEEKPKGFDLDEWKK